VSGECGRFGCGECVGGGLECDGCVSDGCGWSECASECSECRSGLECEGCKWSGCVSECSECGNRKWVTNECPSMRVRMLRDTDLCKVQDTRAQPRPQKALGCEAKETSGHLRPPS